MTRFLVLYAQDGDACEITETLRKHLKITTLRGDVYFEYLNVVGSGITTDKLKEGYRFVLVLITPELLLNFDDWKNLIGYLEHNVAARTVPIYVRTCDFSSTFLSRIMKPWERALSVAKDLDSATVDVVNEIIKLVEKLQHTSRIIKTTPQVPDIAFFANNSEDGRMMEGLMSHIEAILPGRNIWKSWNIPAGSSVEEEIGSARKAEIQIAGLTAGFLADKSELFGEIRDGDNHHACRGFFIALSAAPYDWVFRGHEINKILPSHDRPVTSFSQREDAWNLVAKQIAQSLSQPRMSASELTSAYWNK